MDGKKKRRKGYTLIECLAYISISSIILLMIMNLSIEGYKYSIYRVEKLKREDEIDNAIKSVLGIPIKIRWLYKNFKRKRRF